jgi:hypothetical protein
MFYCQAPVWDNGVGVSAEIREPPLLTKIQTLSDLRKLAGFISGNLRS